MPFSRLLQMHSQVSHMSTRASRREGEYTRRCVRRRLGAGSRGGLPRSPMAYFRQ